MSEISLSGADTRFIFLQKYQTIRIVNNNACRKKPPAIVGSGCSGVFSLGKSTGVSISGGTGVLLGGGSGVLDGGGSVGSTGGRTGVSVSGEMGVLVGGCNADVSLAVGLGLIVAVASEFVLGVADDIFPVLVAGASNVVLGGRIGVREAVAEGVTVGGKPTV
jgi:hypothetical protein